MSFQLTAQPGAAAVITNGNQYSMIANQQMAFQQDQQHHYNSGLILTNIPPSTVLQVSPGDDLLGFVDCFVQRYQQKDIGNQITPRISSRKKSKVKKGDHIFKMILKQISMQILQMIFMTYKNQIQQQQQDQQKLNKSFKRGKKIRKCIL